MNKGEWFVYQIDDFPRGLIQVYWKGVFVGFPTWASSFSDKTIKKFKTYSEARREMLRVGYRRDFKITSFCEVPNAVLLD